jgi:hypothetical protein
MDYTRPEQKKLPAAVPRGGPEVAGVLPKHPARSAAALAFRTPP